MEIRVNLYSAVTPGTVANAGHGDLVIVARSATRRADWGAMLPAIGTAFVRGAAVDMEGTEHG